MPKQEEIEVAAEEFIATALSTLDTIWEIGEIRAEAKKLTALVYSWLPQEYQIEIPPNE